MATYSLRIVVKFFPHRDWKKNTGLRTFTCNLHFICCTTLYLSSSLEYYTLLTLSTGTVNLCWSQARQPTQQDAIMNTESEVLHLIAQHWYSSWSCITWYSRYSCMTSTHLPCYGINPQNKMVNSCNRITILYHHGTQHVLRCKHEFLSNVKFLKVTQN